jgi:hypothetical protein
LVEVIGCCETTPECAEELYCEEYCVESSEDELLDVVGVVVVAVVALAADWVAARWCVATAMPLTRNAVVPTLSTTAVLRLRRAGWGRGRVVMHCMIEIAIEVPVGAKQEDGKNPGSRRISSNRNFAIAQVEQSRAVCDTVTRHDAPPMITIAAIAKR